MFILSEVRSSSVYQLDRELQTLLLPNKLLYQIKCRVHPKRAGAAFQPVLVIVAGRIPGFGRDNAPRVGSDNTRNADDALAVLVASGLPRFFK